MEKKSNIKLTLDQGLAIARDVQADLSSDALADILGVKRAFLLRRSVDARRKRDVHFVVTAGVGAGKGAPQAATALGDRPLPQLRECAGARPVVVGMGPAGLFAALQLAEAGMRPIVIERGAPVDARTADVEGFKRTRVLNTQSNVQFGEGGAGTFSDGKLTTGKNSPLITQVLQTFVAAGAPLEILWQAKPHIGTDVLCGVVQRMRERIIACGGEVHFYTQLTGMKVSPGGELLECECETSEGGEPSKRAFAVSHLVLACGHSARDTFTLLKELDFELAPKPFSMGVRIEHAQDFINQAQYGEAAGHPALGAADYKLSCHLPNGRSVYSFCMCPGGELVAASSEDERLCVNGMSLHARAGANANAALLCNVTPEDFPHADDPLSGIELQRSWEHASFVAGGGDWSAPAERVGSFMGVRAKAHNMPEPTYPLGVKETRIAECLPAYIADALREALPKFDKNIRGFADPGAIMTGIEARSSSPVRIVRDPQTLMATRVHGVYPCGEGAGYAGGIMSAAIDGLKVAQAIIGS